jgi:UDP-glucose 4-epimerase
VTRDFIFVRDLAELCAAATTSGIEGVFNAGSGVGTSVNEVIAAVSAASGNSPEVAYRPGRAIDVPRSVLDVSLARRTFGWVPATQLPTGLARTWEWLQTVP